MASVLLQAPEQTLYTDSMHPYSDLCHTWVNVCRFIISYQSGLLYM